MIFPLFSSFLFCFFSFFLFCFLLPHYDVEVLDDSGETFSFLAYLENGYDFKNSMSLIDCRGFKNIGGKDAAIVYRFIEQILEQATQQIASLEEPQLQL